MKKLLTLLTALMLLLGLTAAHAEDACQLHLQIEFDQNIIMARYDADVYLNGTKVATIEHGGELDAVFTIPQGRVEITFRSVKNPAVYGTTLLEVGGSCTYACEIHANLADIELRDVTTDAVPYLRRVGMGVPVTVGDLQVQVNGYRTVTSVGSNRPGAGNVYLICEVECLNLSKGDLAFSAPLFFEGCVDDYEIDLAYSAMFDQYSVTGLVDDLNQSSEVLRPGKRVKAELIFEVPGDWQTLELYYLKTVLGGDEVVFVIDRK